MRKCATKIVITRTELLQRIRDWRKRSPNHLFHRYRPGTANFRRYGQAAATWPGGHAEGVFEDVARTAGILKAKESTVDEEATAVLLELVRAGSLRPSTSAFSRWFRKHPDYRRRIEFVAGLFQTVGNAELMSLDEEGT